MDKYLVRSTSQKDDETGEFLYWNNTFGWVDKESAEIFDSNDFSQYLPAESVLEHYEQK